MYLSNVVYKSIKIHYTYAAIDSLNQIKLNYFDISNKLSTFSVVCYSLVSVNQVDILF